MTTQKRTFKGNEITKELLASMFQKQVTAKVKQYSYHTHGTWRSGTIVSEFGKGTEPTYYFSSNEYYGLSDIMELVEGWD